MTTLQALNLAMAALENLRYGYDFPASNEEASIAIEILFSLQKRCPQELLYAAEAGVTALSKMRIKFGNMARKRMDKGLSLMPLLIDWADREEQDFYVGCLVNLRQFTEALEVEW